MKKKYKKVKKAQFGLQEVEVPPAGSAGDVLSSAAAGASAGAAFGPWGAAIGGAVGTATGFLTKGAKDRANKKAINTNKYVNTQKQYSLDETPQANQVYKQGVRKLKAHPPTSGEISRGMKPRGKYKLRRPGF